MIKILFLLKVEAEVPPEIINNVGSLQYRLGKHEVRASHILTARWLQLSTQEAFLSTGGEAVFRGGDGEGHGRGRGGREILQTHCHLHQVRTTQLRHIIFSFCINFLSELMLKPSITLGGGIVTILFYFYHVGWFYLVTRRLQPVLILVFFVVA